MSHNRHRDSMALNPSGPAAPPGRGPAMSRRPRAKRGGESVKLALVRAGQRLFSDHPVDAVAIDDIVGVAGVAKGSFYNHFPDKETLLEAVALRIRSRIEEEVATANALVSDPARRIARAICVYLRFVAEEPEQGGVLVRNDGNPPRLPAMVLNKVTVDDVRTGLAQGRFAVPTVEAGALFILGVGHAGLVRVNGDRGATSNIWIAQQLCQLMLRGLGVASGEAELISAEAAEEILRQPRTAGDLDDE